MARLRSKPHSFEERLHTYRSRLEHRLQETESEDEKAQIERQISDVDAALTFNRWLSPRKSDREVDD